MTHDDALRERYPDLLGPDDADSTEADLALLRLIRDLDGVYAAPEPPLPLAASIEAGIQRILQDRSALLPAAHSALAPRASVSSSRLGPHLSRGGTPVTSRRLSLVLGSLAAVLVVGLMAALLLGTSLRPGGSGPGSGGQETFQQRWDRLGGLKIILKASCLYAEPGCDISARMPQLVAALNERISHSLGMDARYADVGEPGAVAVFAGDAQGAKGSLIDIALAGYTDQNRAVFSLGHAGELDFIDTHGNLLQPNLSVIGKLCTTSCRSDQYTVLFTGAQLDPATVAASTGLQNGQPIITFGFAGTARDQFAAYTRTHLGGALTIALDGVVIESATIQSEIPDKGQIIGIPSLQDAQRVAALITSPLPFQPMFVSLVQVPPHSQPTTSCVTPTPSATPTPSVLGLPTPTPAAVAPTTVPTPTLTLTFTSPGAPTPTAGDDTPPTPNACATPTLAPPATPTPAQ